MAQRKPSLRVVENKMRTGCPGSDSARCSLVRCDSGQIAATLSLPFPKRKMEMTMAPASRTAEKTCSYKTALSTWQSKLGDGCYQDGYYLGGTKDGLKMRPRLDLR